MQTFFTQEPGKILYMPLPNGKADVWLRKDIAEVETEDSSGWAAEEIYFRTTLTKDEVEADFETIFANGGTTVDEDTGEEVTDGITTADRLDAIEAAIAELAEVIANG